MKPAITSAVNRRSELRACACCLYSLGLGGKRIGRKLGKAHNLVIRWIKQAGIFDPSSAIHRRRSRLVNRLCATTGISDSKAARAYMDARTQDIRMLRAGDERTHWANHPGLAMWAYYKDHESSKARSRINARRNYEKRKGDAEWMFKRREKCGNWRRKNPEKKKLGNLRWLEKAKTQFPEKLKAWRRVARAKNRQNPKWRAANNLRRRTRDFVKGKDPLTFSELHGCARRKLWEWLEAKFKRGMTWGNYGTHWDIDHVFPISKSKTDSPEARRIVSHYTNLQPLWKAENNAKSDKIVPHQPELAIPLAA